MKDESAAILAELEDQIEEASQDEALLQLSVLDGEEDLVPLDHEDNLVDDEVVAEESVLDEVVADEVVDEEALPDEVVTEEALTDEVVPDEVVDEEVIAVAEAEDDSVPPVDDEPAAEEESVPVEDEVNVNSASLVQFVVVLLWLL